MKVLVTGGDGFIGRATCQELRQRGHEPVIFDRKRQVSGNLILGDIRDATAVTEAVAHADAVIHLAGVLGTQETIANPLPAAETNILGGLNVLQACAQYGAPLVNIAVGNWFEFSTYSISKTTVDRFTVMYARHRGLHACSVRAFNAYGPGQSVAQPYGTSRVRKVVPSFLSRALHGETIQVYGDGSQVMDMIYVTDVARCLVQALEQGKPGLIYEAGTGRRTTILEVARCAQAVLREQAGIQAGIEHLPMRPGETPGSEVLADPDKVRGLGLDPLSFVQLEDGMAEAAAHYRRMFA